MNIHIQGMPSEQELNELKIREFGSVEKADAICKYAKARTKEIVEECAAHFDISKEKASSILSAGIEANQVQDAIAQTLTAVLERFGRDDKGVH